jgi:hypothetical protein
MPVCLFVCVRLPLSFSLCMLVPLCLFVCVTADGMLDQTQTEAMVVFVPTDEVARLRAGRARVHHDVSALRERLSAVRLPRKCMNAPAQTCTYRPCHPYMQRQGAHTYTRIHTHTHGDTQRHTELVSTDACAGTG